MKPLSRPRTADYYLSLRYTVSLRKLRDEEGGGYRAAIPELGSKTFVADGDTPDAAVSALEDLRRLLIPSLVGGGRSIPEPIEDEEPPRYSGSLMLRIPPSLHEQLADAARSEGVSINKLSTQIIAQGLMLRSVRSGTDEAIREVIADHIRTLLANWHENGTLAHTVRPGANQYLTKAESGSIDSGINGEYGLAA